jgi:hypothetical protein
MSSDIHTQFTRLTPEQAAQAYAALVTHAGARPNEDDVAGFVYELTRQTPTNEFRFGGALGMGGKFRFPRMTVDCYREDETPERLAMIVACNAALAELRESFNAAAAAA